MRIHYKLDEILRQGSKIKVFRFLFTQKDEHTGRNIAKSIGMSPSSTHNILQDMRKEGLISVRSQGNAILYKLKEDNYIVKELLGPLFKKEKHIYSHVVSFIKRRLCRAKRGIVTIAVFGSVARKEEEPGSDMDLLILLKNRDRKTEIGVLLDKLYVDMVKNFGVAISPYVLTISEIRQRYRQKRHIIKSILDNNELIFGEPIERIIS